MTDPLAEVPLQQRDAEERIQSQREEEEGL